ncbi:MAG: alpha/beta hydrolase-fold protein [Bacteroidota bacterium]
MEEQLIRIAYQSEVTGKERDYYIFLPRNYDQNRSEPYPVLLFLHGNGERGNAKSDLDFVLKWGPLYEAWIQKKDLPFIMIVPQLPMFGMDEQIDYIKNRSRDEIPIRLANGVQDRPALFPTNEPMNGQLSENEMPFPLEGLPMGWPEVEAELVEMVKKTQSTYNADVKRTYISGLSYGGFGTWWMISKHPEMFAAAAPVVGYAHPDLMEPIAENKIPIWAFAGGRDGAVPVKYFYASLNRLESLGHKPRFTIHADMNHDAWVRIYQGDDLYNWMLEQRN